MPRHYTSGAGGWRGLIIITSGLAILLVVVVLAVMGGFSRVYGASPPHLPYKLGETVVGVDGLAIWYGGIADLEEDMAILVSESRTLGKGGLRVAKLETAMHLGQPGIFTAPDGRSFSVIVHTIEKDGSVVASFTIQPPRNNKARKKQLAVKQHIRAPPHYAKRPR